MVDLASPVAALTAGNLIMVCNTASPINFVGHAAIKSPVLYDFTAIAVTITAVSRICGRLLSRIAV
jgi:hypothetical protein